MNSSFNKTRIIKRFKKIWSIF